jgi:hypothetical protein
MGSSVGGMFHCAWQEGRRNARAGYPRLKIRRAHPSRCRRALALARLDPDSPARTLAPTGRNGNIDGFGESPDRPRRGHGLSGQGPRCRARVTHSNRPWAIGAAGVTAAVVRDLQVVCAGRCACGGTLRPKLRWLGCFHCAGLGFCGLAGLAGVYVMVRGMGAPISSKARRWAGVGVVSLSMGWLPTEMVSRVRVARWSIRSRKLR